MKQIGFIGIGVMGKSMARNLMKKGYSLTVYTRTQASAQELLEEGAAWAQSPAACARASQAVITMVGFPKDVQEVYFGENGVFAGMQPGGYVIDMTTTSPSLSVAIAAEAQKRGLHALDAPVSGGDVGAQKGTLAIMVGGEKEAFDACLPLFEAMGTNIRYEGPAGSGQHTKMANQIAVAGAVAGVAEALAYAKKQGLDLQQTLDTIGTGAAGSWQMTNNGPKMIAADFAPGFYIKHIVKDLAIADEQASAAALALPMTRQVLAMYKSLAESGLGDLGTQALVRYFDE